MVDKKISELPDAGAAASGDIVPITQVSTSTTKKITLGAIVTLVVAAIATAATIATLTTSTIKPASDAVNALKITKADGTTSVMSIDTTNGRVGIGTTAPYAKLYVEGVSPGSGDLDAIYGAVSGGTGNNYGVDGEATGGGENYGVYGFANGGSANYGIFGQTNDAVSGWAGYFQGRGYFSGNVGIGTTAPAQKLEINGGLRLNTATAKPTCAAGIRGTLWYVQGGAGVADTMEACTKDAGDAYAWRALY